MARKLRVVRNPEGLEYGDWIPVHAVKFNDDGSVSMMAEGRTANPTPYQVMSLRTLPSGKRKTTVLATYSTQEEAERRRRKEEAKPHRHWPPTEYYVHRPSGIF